MSPTGNGLSPSQSVRDGQDVRLTRAVEEYLAALEAGHKPDRREFLERHTDIAGPLAECLGGLEFVNAAAADIHSQAAGSPTAPDASPLGESLGDFRIIREVGKGGMGVVYEAEQVSLRRRVALKVLPFAATMDPRHLRRFQNEAQAAACLHHTNIVPVYFVGCERGVHFYAMQFIDGQPLSELIRYLAQGPMAPEEQTTAYEVKPGETPAATPTVRVVGDATPLTGEGKRGREYFRKVAELGVQAAEALDHAHQLGIVHRDVKPANLMVDAAGVLWLTDFGLAQLQRGEGGLTMTGDLVGTLRYMSPEQALAKRVVIDHRTDVYSLGVTLYELLTLRPAFDGRDRQEVLREVAFEEPRRPRQLNRAIPTELQTIVLKAMEKNPTDRYATAQELADDLRRWLLDMPIRARRPTLAQRLDKWSRRHTAAVRAAGATAVMVLAVLAVLVWVLWDWTLRRERTEQAVVQALDESMHAQAEGKLPEALSAAQRAEAIALGGSASKRLWQQARARLDDLTRLDYLESIRMRSMGVVADGAFDLKGADKQYGLVFATLLGDPHSGMEEELVDIGTTLLAAELAAERIGRTTTAVELAAELDHWALIRQKLRGADDPSWKAFLQVARLADPDPRRARVREALERRDGQALLALASSRGLSGLSNATLTLLLEDTENKLDIDQKEAFLREAQRRHPNDFELNTTLFRFYSRVQPPNAEEAYHFAAVAVALRPGNWHARIWLGYALLGKGLLDETIAEFREVIRMTKDVPDMRGNPKMVNALAHTTLGELLEQKGQFSEALVYRRRGHEFGSKYPLWPYPSAQWVRNCERLVELDGKLPAILSGQKQPADTTERLALAQLCQMPCKQQYLAAQRFYSAAFAEKPKLADDLDEQHRYNAACSAALTGCGQGKDADKLDAKERHCLRQQALDWLRDDLKAYRQQMDKAPDKAGPQIAQRMQHWLQDTDFASVRSPEGLARLPEAERSQWQQLWNEVAQMLAKAQRKVKKPDTK